MKLFNQHDRDTLARMLNENPKERVTLSFYQYAHIGNPHLFRDHLYIKLGGLEVLGRIYVANEGINAQISVPAEHFEGLRNTLNEIVFLQDIRLNLAIEERDTSFLKLKLKVRNKIVADGLADDSFDVTKKGIHVDAENFNKLAEDPETVIVDMRNHYESEIGHFENAVTPDVDTFRESLPIIEKQIEAYKDKKLLMYCTGGIRCEKASAYYKHKGFKNVYQLEGGIIEYARQVNEKGLENKFKGANFVFDDRMMERISDDVISKCHQCGDPHDVHTNCINDACHLLFLQCDSCKEEHHGCCSPECMEFMQWSEEDRKTFRKGHDFGNQIFKKGRESQFAAYFREWKKQQHA